MTKSTPNLSLATEPESVVAAVGSGSHCSKCGGAFTKSGWGMRSPRKPDTCRDCKCRIEAFGR